MTAEIERPRRGSAARGAVVSARRSPSATDSETRSKLLDAAEQLMLDEGYAAVTSRRVERQAGISSQLVHYHFGSMDGLFIEIIRRRSEAGLHAFRQLIEGDDLTLRTLWDVQSSVEGRFEAELAALANHRKVVGVELIKYAEQFRSMSTQAMTKLLARHGLSPRHYPPRVMVMALTGLGQLMGLERGFGMTDGHADALAFMDQLLTSIEGRALTLATPVPTTPL
jgi:TetR/AcrR family transcriptional regulator